jgi:hypothetical protein
MRRERVAGGGGSGALEAQEPGRGVGRALEVFVENVVLALGRDEVVEFLDPLHLGRRRRRTRCDSESAERRSSLRGRDWRPGLQPEPSSLGRVPSSRNPSSGEKGGAGRGNRPARGEFICRACSPRSGLRLRRLAPAFGLRARARALGLFARPRSIRSFACDRAGRPCRPRRTASRPSLAEMQRVVELHFHRIVSFAEPRSHAARRKRGSRSRPSPRVIVTT